MKRRKVTGVIDLFEVSDPSEIKALVSDRRLDRRFEASTYPVDWLLLKRALRYLWTTLGVSARPTLGFPQCSKAFGNVRVVQST